MAGAQGPWLPLPPLWLWCWVQVLLAPPGLWPARAFNLHSDHPTIYTGPHHSYFGFAMDFFQGSKGGMSVVVGAPRANTSQPGVVEAGAVYLCPWAPGGTRCSIIEFDPKGDQAETNGLLQLKTYKSHQWFGASVSSWGDNIVACAPLQHWNVFEDKAQATQTPVGTCFVATEGLSRFAEYSPCRCQHMEAVYQKRGHCLTPSPSVPTAHSAEGPHAGRSLPTPLGPRFTLGRPNPGIWLPRGPSSSLPAEEAGCGALTNEGRQRCQLASRWPGQMSGFLAQPGSLAMPSEDHSQTPQGQPPNIPQLPLPQERGTNAAVPLSTVNDKRYCELGFSATITHAGRLVLGAPGGYYFVGLIYSVNLSAVVSHVPGSALLWSVAPEQVTEDMYNEYDDAYRGECSLPQQPAHLMGYFGGRGGVRMGPAYARKDDILVGAPLYMVSRSDHKLYEVGRVYLYLQHRGPHPYRHPAQTMTGTEVFGRFGTAIAPAGDLDQDGYVDVAVGAPFAGSGRVLIFRGCSEGLRTPASQVLESPFPGRAAFGFSVRGATDIDANGYPDVLVGAFGASKVAVYRAQPVVVASSQLLVPDVLNPEEKACAVDRTPVSCFTIQAVVRAIKGKSLRENKTALALCSAWPQTRIVLDCGEDNVCVPELQLAAHTPVSQLFIGAENVVHILADATNVGEGAFEAELRLQLPHDAHYQKATSNVQGLEKLICNLKKENETRVVICELGNPMKNGTKITVDMALSISNLEDAGDTIEFQLQLWSKNSHSPHSNMERVQIPIKAAARLDLRGNSLPATMVLPVVGWELAEGSRRLEDHGPKVEHVYQLHNQGPGTVSQAELWVEFPNKFQGDFLLYMVELSTEGRINCSSPTGLNPLGLEGQKPTASPGHNMSYQLVHRRERREADKAEAGPGTLRDPTLVNCSSQSCVAVLCKVEMLERDQRAMVTVHSILWMQSVWKRPHDQFIIQSQAWFNVSAMPYRIQPEVLPSGHATAHTEVVRVSPDAEKEIPTWWVVLAVLAGLLLLALFICALWKMGFFKRTRPPMDDQEELTSDETREPCTGKGQ
ncbi:LOW QUALITY PROTEIN: integrin alpha-IIb [Chelonoidis abingdonii]|uniref:LOW QUALITY PROTEIN: integrin alpha-IIb n=1 Tax=Chelonoidis abingdonii TaxID=106734 RepID=UPI003F495C23